MRRDRLGRTDLGRTCELLPAARQALQTMSAPGGRKSGAPEPYAPHQIRSQTWCISTVVVRLEAPEKASAHRLGS